MEGWRDGGREAGRQGGREAGRQRGSEAARQRGSEAARQRGSEADHSFRRGTEERMKDFRATAAAKTYGCASPYDGYMNV